MLMAGAAASGMGALVIQFYQTDDYAEQQLLRQILSKGIDIDGDRREDQAVRIINQLGAAMNRKNNKTATHG